jgi:hypothetical protein
MTRYQVPAATLNLELACRQIEKARDHIRNARSAA